MLLVPSRELVAQHVEEAKRLAHGLPVRVERLSSAQRSSRKERRDLGLRGRGRRYAAASDPALAHPISLLVCTPGRLLSFVQRRALSLSSVLTLIVDEADVLLEARAGFREDVERIVEAVGRRGAAQPGPPPLLLFVAASVGPALRTALHRLCPELLDCSSSTLHTLPPALRMRFVAVSAASKMEAVVAEVRRAVEGRGRVLVFCNTVPSCRALFAALSSRLSSPSLVAASHGALPPSVRSAQFAAFARGEAAVLVCTDLASRGLHLPTLTHVVQFDMALNAVDFLHRVGRLQRCTPALPAAAAADGAAGIGQEAVALLLKGDRVLAAAIQVGALHHLCISAVDRSSRAPLTMRSSAPLCAVLLCAVQAQFAARLPVSALSSALPRADGATAPSARASRLARRRRIHP